MPYYPANRRYDQANTKCFSLKLNKKTDADLLEFLEGKAVQTEIKRVLREYIARHPEE